MVDIPLKIELRLSQLAIELGLDEAELIKAREIFFEARIDGLCLEGAWDLANSRMREMAEANRERK